MDLFTTGAGIEFLARYGHVLAGIAWIGLLYYFNFVQTEYFKEADGAARTDAFVKLVPRALWLPRQPWHRGRTPCSRFPCCSS